MANTLTKTTDGAALFDSNEGKTAGDNYSGGASHSSGTGWVYRNIARGGDANNICVEKTGVGAGAWDYLSYRTYTSNSILIVGCWFQFFGANDYALPYIGVADGADANTYQFGYFNQNKNLTSVYNGALKALANTANLTEQTWYYIKTIISTLEYTVQIYDVSGVKIAEINLKSYHSHPTTNTWGGLRIIANTKVYFDNLAIQKDTKITVAGIVDKMSVTLKNSAGTILNTERSTGTSLTLDIKNYVDIIGESIEIYGTDGALMHTESGINVWGGDVWIYSGDTATPSSIIPPSQIGTLTVTSESTNTSLIQFTPVTADGFNIYRSENLSNNFSFVTSGTGGTYTDNTVIDGRDYWYYVVGTSDSGGASIPSQLKNVFIGTNIDYMTNIMTTLKNTFTSNIIDIKAIQFGAEEVMPYQYPFMSIIPQNRDDEPITVGYSGQYDKIFNFTLRTYTGVSSGAGAVGTALSILSEVESKVAKQLEALKTNNPYWYTSDITSVQYGDAVVDEIKLKFIDLNWMAKKRINR